MNPNRFLIAAAFAAVSWAAGAEAPAAPQSLFRAVDDPALEWGPCPPFIPEGCKIAVLHGNPAAKDADVFFKVPGGFDIPEHWHTSAERMVLVKGELAVTYKGQAPFTLEEGMYAYGPARQPHSAHCASRGECVLFIAFDQPVDAHSMDEKPEAPKAKSKAKPKGNPSKPG